MEAIEDCDVVSDRYLDVVGPWRWNNVLILDDSLIVGSTLHALADDLKGRVGHSGTVTTAVVAVDREQAADFLLQSCNLVGAPQYRTSVEVERFSLQINRCLFRAGIPFFSDFPTTKSLTIPLSEWIDHLARMGWQTADVTAPLFVDTGRAAYSHIPTESAEQDFLKRLPEPIGALVEAIKLRSFVRRTGSRPRILDLRLVPIALILPCTIQQVDCALMHIEDFLDAGPKRANWREWTPEAKHRAVQLFVSACVLHFALDAVRDRIQPNFSGDVLDRTPLSLYFGHRADFLLAAFDQVSGWLNKQPLDEAPVRLEFNRPRRFRLLDEQQLQYVLAEERELIQSAGVPSEPNVGELTKIGLLFSHSIATVFGFISSSYERPQRQRIASCVSVEEYRRLLDEDGYVRVLNEGFTLRELKESLNPASLGRGGWPGSVLTLGIDIGNDLGIIVPVTKWDSVRRVVFRCYRIGETAVVADRPLLRAVENREMDQLSRLAAREGFPFHSTTAPISSVGDARTNMIKPVPDESGVEKLEQTVKTSVPGVIVEELEGRVVEVLPDGDLLALLYNPADDTESFTTLSAERFWPVDDGMQVSAGKAITWTVFERTYDGFEYRSPRIQIRSSVELPENELDRTAAALSCLRDDI